MKVRFFPVAEQYADIANEVQKRKGIKQSNWVSFSIYYCVVNVFLVPAILLYFERYIFAALAFGVTMAFSLAYTKIAGASSYSSYYRQWFEKDPEEIEVELLEDGIQTSCDVCSTFYRWRSIDETRETAEAIYFLTKDCGIAIPKTAFKSATDLTDFTEFAASKTSGK